MINFYTFYQIYHLVIEIGWIGCIDSNLIDGTIELSYVESTRHMWQFKVQLIFLNKKFCYSVIQATVQVFSRHMWRKWILNSADIEYVHEFKEILLDGIARIMSLLTRVVFFTLFLYAAMPDLLEMWLIQGDWIRLYSCPTSISKPCSGARN